MKLHPCVLDHFKRRQSYLDDSNGCCFRALACLLLRGMKQIPDQGVVSLPLVMEGSGDVPFFDIARLMRVVLRYILLVMQEASEGCAQELFLAVSLGVALNEHIGGTKSKNT